MILLKPSWWVADIGAITLPPACLLPGKPPRRASPSAQGESTLENSTEHRLAFTTTSIYPAIMFNPRLRSPKQNNNLNLWHPPIFFMEFPPESHSMLTSLLRMMSLNCEKQCCFNWNIWQKVAIRFILVCYWFNLIFNLVIRYLLKCPVNTTVGGGGWKLTKYFSTQQKYVGL